MSDNKPDTKYTASNDFYKRKEAQRENEARRSVSEKMAAVVRLRDFEQKLDNIRKVNRARRAAKEITIQIKTR